MESLGLKRVHRDVSAVMLARGRSVAALQRGASLGKLAAQRNIVGDLNPA